MEYEVRNRKGGESDGRTEGMSISANRRGDHQHR